MEEQRTEIMRRPGSAAFSPSDTRAATESLAASIESAVRKKTSGGIRNLCVEVTRSGVVLEGRCDTYYCKQLAQQAAMNFPGNNISNEIRVSPKKR